jgi:hypothetical protein
MPFWVRRVCKRERLCLGMLAIEAVYYTLDRFQYRFLCLLCCVEFEAPPVHTAHPASLLVLGVCSPAKHGTIQVQRASSVSGCCSGEGG